MMKRKGARVNMHAGTGRTCGECCRGEWNMNNFNYKGKPFLCYCEHSTHAKTKDGRGVCYDNTEACRQFKDGSKKKGGTL